MTHEISSQKPSEPLLRQFEDLTLPEGKLLSVFIGRSGVFVIASEDTDPEALFTALRTLLETGRIRVYIPGSGYFAPLRGMIYAQWDEDELTEQIYDWVMGETAAWDDQRTEMLAQRLVHQSNVTRKSFTDADGNRYILKSGVFRPASRSSSDVLFYLTLFGGILGLHRFFCGKLFSGLLYLCTFGLMGLGWLLDILSLFLGIQKDRRKRYYMPLKNPILKLLLLPLGFFITACIFTVQVGFLASVSDAFQAFLTDQIRQTNPSSVRQFEFTIRHFIDSLSK